MVREKKSRRVDTEATPKPLTDNPFAVLSPNGLPAGTPVEEAAPRETECTRVYRVRKTSKGGYHLSMEKRAAGKVVTRIHNVEGDGDALARELKKHCGVGGTYTDGVVELQGDVRGKVETLLKRWLG